MFINEQYDSYKYVVSVSDNYVILTNRKNVDGSWENPQTIDVIYQYLKPSFLCIEGELTVTSPHTYTQVNLSTSDFSRADFCDILTSSMLFLSVVIFTILNSITRLIKKGGLINGQ